MILVYNEDAEETNQPSIFFVALFVAVWLIRMPVMESHEFFYTFLRYEFSIKKCIRLAEDG